MESVILHVKQQFGEETDGLSIPPRFPDPAQTPAGGPPGLSFALLSHCDAPFVNKEHHDAVPPTVGLELSVSSPLPPHAVHPRILLRQCGAIPSGGLVDGRKHGLPEEGSGQITGHLHQKDLSWQPAQNSDVTDEFFKSVSELPELTASKWQDAG